uniref:ATP synthase F0 subunit 8 n=1 Tax=Panagrolaimus sp. JU765 TaxID=591449 RepID=A0AC34R6G3_9BILA
MPHEIILTLIVFLIWALILRHFFVIYNRLTLVSPQSLGGYLTTRKHSTWKSSKELSQSSSKQTLMSKTETKPNFNILEEAAFQWRSETVLSTRRNSDASAPSILKPIGYSSQSAIVGDGFGQRNSNISLFTGTARSSYSGGPVIFLTSSMTPPESRRPSRSHYLVAPGSASVHSCPTAFSTSQSYSAAASKPLLSPEDQENPVVRKVSEVLLGKATNDIRRCSFKQGEDERPNLGRRKSLLESLSGGIRGSFKRKKRKRSPKYEMEALKEEKEGSWTPNELSKSETVAGIGFGKSQVRQKLSETYLGTSQSSNRLESPDSYLTASDSSSTALPE